MNKSRESYRPQQRPNGIFPQSKVLSASEAVFCRSLTRSPEVNATDLSELGAGGEVGMTVARPARGATV
ncbi:hypothetical protein MATL_G00019470 [Megalops atlanticus]|uniref:Uncharacterized protein n=1 Tax=Megalops atlanticus TaxID=7932 RepID=A0A9D3QL52_MEGAT|nr:hypothetical protein MATL_G00019470 [Megalops atlanticus]